jgi:hypothetical protein
MDRFLIPFSHGQKKILQALDLGSRAVIPLRPDPYPPPIYRPGRSPAYSPSSVNRSDLDPPFKGKWVSVLLTNALPNWLSENTRIQVLVKADFFTSCPHFLQPTELQLFLSLFKLPHRLLLVKSRRSPQGAHFA